MRNVCKLPLIARKLEITYNKERDDYHPHFHVLITVNKSYFTDKDYYISRRSESVV